MFRIALKSAIAKKMRLVSTALSVLIGVAFLTGTLVFTDTIRATFDNLFATVYESTDSVVRSTSTIETIVGDQRQRIPDDVVASVAEVDGVESAVGVVMSYSTVTENRSAISAAVRRRSG
jgi:putative ABC transport system permease protein